MDALTEIIARHAEHAHWYVFGGIILAGFNIPISADVLVLLSAVLAATIIPEHTWHLFFSVLLGCYFSAMCAYWLGRLLGAHLQRWRFFTRLLSPLRMKKMRTFYDTHGLWTLVVGRFIPFGVRNGIFMTAGISKMHFLKFILRDALACSLWCGSAFYLFYTLGQNYHVVWHFLKACNLVIFTAFSVTVIGWLWYKRRKKARSISRC